MKNIVIAMSICLLISACTKDKSSKSDQAVLPEQKSLETASETDHVEKIANAPKQHILILQYDTQHQLANIPKDVFSLFDKNVFVTSKAEDLYNQTYNLVRKLNTGELVEGDKVYLYINAHGGKKAVGNQQGHVFIAEDGDFNIARLSPLIQTMLNKGIKVALSDQSCYSGESLEYFKNQTELKNLCLLTADSNKQVAVATGTDHFLSFVKETKSFDLERAYVSGRVMNFYAAPGINSDIFEDFHRRTLSLQKHLGKEAGAENIWIYLQKYSALDGKRLNVELMKADLLEPLKKEFQDVSVNLEQEFKAIDSALESFSQKVNEIYFQDPEIYNLLTKTITTKDGSKTTHLEKLVYVSSGQQSSDFYAGTQYNMDIANNRTPSISKEAYDLIEKRRLSFKDIDLARDPELEKINDRFAKLESGDFALKITLGPVESNLHNKFYNEQLKNGKSKSNPCRDFSLNQN